MKLPFVSIIIPTYREWTHLGICLQALEAQSYPRDQFEVIVVDNDPDQSSYQLALAPNQKLLAQPRPGPYAARNTGIRAAQGEIMGFTDADCIPSENWIETAARALSSQNQFQRLGGRIELFSRTDEPNLAELYELIFAFPQQEYVQEKQFAATANMFARRVVFEQIGLFRWDMISGGDHEWGRRADKAGFPIQYFDELVVRHPARQSIKQLALKRRRVAHGQNQLSQVNRKGKPIAWFEFLYRIRPPLRRSLQLFSSRLKISLPKKAKLSLLTYYLRIVYEYELWQLSKQAFSDGLSIR